MATTIYGCVSWPSGEITFENLEECLVQAPEFTCITLVGEHAGQVAIMLSGANNEDCNDTFYGCVNWSTGKFQIVIPEDCCIVVGDDCQYCEPGTTPKYIKLAVSGVQPMGCCSRPGDGFSFETISADVNGVYSLEQITSCLWGKEIEYGNFGEVRIYWYGEECSGPPIVDYFSRRDCRVEKRDNDTIFATVYLFAELWECGFSYLGTPSIQGCVFASLSNQCACPGAPWYSYGGVGGSAAIGF